MRVKRMGAVLLCLAMVLGICACGSDIDAGVGIEEKLDRYRTQLYVSNFNGGYGDKWLRRAKERFEEKYKDVSLETGKKGVQVLIDNAKTSGTGLINSIGSLSTQVFFTESVSYRDYVSKGLLLDLTDMVNEKLTEYGEERSVFDKFNAVQQKYLTVNGKIYAVPHYDGFNGITVDMDLLDEKSLFLGKDGRFLYKSTNASQLSAGPDGDYSTTYDNGFPATYDEFYEWCKQMANRNVTPVTWSGEHQFYAKDLVVAMAADDNGYEETERGFSFSGEAKNLVDLDTLTPDSYTTESGTIDNEHGYDILRQEGYYNALKFLHTLIDRKYYSSTSFTDGQSQIDTQKDYLLSNKDSSYKPIAMLVEGCWWENEASAVFDRMSNYPNAGRYERRFRFLPFPKSSQDKVGNGQTFVENIMSYGFINANIEPQFKDLALDFLQFCNTDASLVDFTVTTNTTKALQYEMSEEDLNKCTYYGRSIYERKNGKDAHVVYPLSDNPLYNENYSTLAMTYRITYGAHLFPSMAFKEHGLTAETYFKELNSSLKSVWKTRYGKYYA